MIADLILIILLIAFAVQIAFYLFLYTGVIFFKKKTPSKVLKPLSVIISARNESENLKKFLPNVLNQTYFDFEVIVVNDRSDDDTSVILHEFKHQFENLKIIEVDSISESSGKKDALTLGINSSKNEYLVFTDADCYPISKNWLINIYQSYTDKTEIILGYGAYENERGFLNKIIRFETLVIAMQYFSYAVKGFTYMGVGRNLSYKKSIFIRNNGFESHKDLQSGDDDLFVNETSTKENISVCLDKESKTISVPKRTFNEYINQKRRHFQTAFRYKTKHKLLMGLEVFSRLIFYLTLICLLVINKWFILVTALYIIRLLTQYGIIGLFSKKMNEKKISIFIPIFDILIPILNLFAVVGTYFNKDKEIKWK